MRKFDVFRVGEAQLKILDIDEEINNEFHKFYELIFNGGFNNWVLDFQIKGIVFFNRHINDHSIYDDFFSNFTIAMKVLIQTANYSKLKTFGTM